MRNRDLRSARISEPQFRKISQLLCTEVGALTASKFCKVNNNTTHWIYGLLRSRVVALAEAQSAPFTGNVEVDESYFGPGRIRGMRGQGAGRKVAVLGLLKRREMVYCSPAMDCSKAELMRVIKGQVTAEGSTIYTMGGVLMTV